MLKVISDDTMSFYFHVLIAYLGWPHYRSEFPLENINYSHPLDHFVKVEKRVESRCQVFVYRDLCIRPLTKSVYTSSSLHRAVSNRKREYLHRVNDANIEKSN